MITIEDASVQDAEAIAEIYNPYVLGSTATFEMDAIDAAEMARRMAAVQDAGLPWLLARQGDAVLGYAYASSWKTRAAYARTVETSIYLAPQACGAGFGKRLYVALLDRLRENRIHVAIGGIAQPNPVSVRLHEALGFSPIGCFREVGWKQERWVDVGYWQLMLEAA